MNWTFKHFKSLIEEWKYVKKNNKKLSALIKMQVNNKKSLIDDHCTNHG